MSVKELLDKKYKLEQSILDLIAQFELNFEGRIRVGSIDCEKGTMIDGSRVILKIKTELEFNE